MPLTIPFKESGLYKERRNVLYKSVCERIKFIQLPEMKFNISRVASSQQASLCFINSPLYNFLLDKEIKTFDVV